MTTLTVVCEHFQPHRSPEDRDRRFLGFARFRLELAPLSRGIVFSDCRVYQDIRRGEPRRTVQFPGHSYEAAGRKLFQPAVQFAAAQDFRAFEAAALAALDRYEQEAQACARA